MLHISNLIRRATNNVIEYYELLCQVVFNRYLFLAGAIAYQVGFRNSDRFYTPLPLYHTAGGAMCVGQAVIYGATVVIRKKFSASQYFLDVVKYECTVNFSSFITK